MWATSKIESKNTQNERGFTIVELLIVVVVIAILAAITIVAYNGIQDRTKQSAAQSALAQANKKILAFYVTHSDTYPTSLGEAEVNNANGGLEYSYDNGSTPKTYGLTSTIGKYSYYVSNTVSKPTAGGYPGHAQGGVASATNRFLNPTYDGPAGPSVQAGTTVSIDTYSGSMMAKAVTTTGTAASLRLSGNPGRWAISEGQSVYASAMVYNASAGARQFTLNIRYYDTASTTNNGTQIGSPVNSTGITIPAGGSATLTVPVSAAPAGTASVGLNVNRDAVGGAVSGDVYYVDNVYLSDTQAGYADGDTQKWTWIGPQYNSISSGPIVSL